MLSVFVLSSVTVALSVAAAAVTITISADDVVLLHRCRLPVMDPSRLNPHAISLEIQLSLNLRLISRQLAYAVYRLHQVKPRVSFRQLLFLSSRPSMIVVGTFLPAAAAATATATAVYVMMHDRDPSACQRAQPPDGSHRCGYVM